VNRRAFKSLRNALGIGQQLFGEALGFGVLGSRNRISEIERGDAPISRHVAMLCRYIEKFGLLPEHEKRRRLRIDEK